ncbi:hypothetical protein JCM13664_09550 [Methylothermus subterraneus]
MFFGLASSLFLKPAFAWSWREATQCHGFLAQGYTWTSSNNFYGHSETGSPNFTELGANLRIEATPYLNFSAQGIYRHAGKVENRLQLDFALADLAVLSQENYALHLRAGRVKNPFGLYNETRDVAFTRPSILLPQGIYFDRTRALFLSSDGGQMAVGHYAHWGDLTLAINVGMPRHPDGEVAASIFGFNTPGRIQANRPMYLVQLRYEYNAGEWIFALSYADAELEYNTGTDDPVVLLAETPFQTGVIRSRPVLFSAQYNAEKFSVTGEYLIQFNETKHFGSGFNRSLASESGYVQGQYRILDRLQAIVRYDVYFLDRTDRSGKNLGLEPFRPRHAAFAKDWMVGLRWEITPNWMVSTEYHNVNGTGWLPFKDNQDPNKNRKEWGMVLGLIAFRF